MASKIIPGLDKTFSIRSTEWHNQANVPLGADGQPVKTLLLEHVQCILHPLITLVNLGDDGKAFDGALPEAALQEVQAWLSAGDASMAFDRLRAALYPDRIMLPDYKGVAADMRHCGGGIVPLAVHSDSYKELENSLFWQAKERALANIPHVVTTAGTLDGCKRFYVSIELPEWNFTAGGEKFQQYLSMLTSHDGTAARQALISRRKIVCDNTYQDADATATHRSRHTSGADPEWKGFEKFLADAMTGQLHFVQQYEKAMETPVASDVAMKFLTGYMLRKHDTTGKAGNARLSTQARNQIDEIMDKYMHGIGNHGETLADLMNGITEHYTHGGGTGLTVNGRDKTALEKYSASEWGGAAETKREAVRIILAADGTEMEEIIALGESKGLDAYLEGTGRSKPVYMSGLDRARAVSGAYGERVSTPVAPSGGSDFASLLSSPLDRRN